MSDDLKDRAWPLSTVRFMLENTYSYGMVDSVIVANEVGIEVLVKRVAEELISSYSDLSIATGDVRADVEHLPDYGVRVSARWRPLDRPIRLVGGPVDGKFVTGQGVPPEPMDFTVLDEVGVRDSQRLELFQEPDPVDKEVVTHTVRYQLCGWDPAQRHWLFSKAVGV